MGLRFADSFWDEHDRGVQVIAEKLETAWQTCQEIQKLYDIRAQIEQNYGEQLLKLSQVMLGQGEEGTLGQCIAHVPSAMETTGRAHVDLSNRLRQHLGAPLLAFLKDQTEKSKAQYQQIENSRHLKQIHRENVARARDDAIAQWTKLKGIEKYLNQKKNDMSADELTQINDELEEQRKQVRLAENEYKKAVDVLNDVTRKWINDWQSTCDMFQTMEEARISFIRNSLSSFANMISSANIVDDQCCERIRAALDSTDVNKDIDLFIRKYGTGTSVTALMPYEDLSLAENGSQFPNRGVQPPPPTASLPPIPPDVPTLPGDPVLPGSPEPFLPSVSFNNKPRVTRTISDSVIINHGEHETKRLPRNMTTALILEDDSVVQDADSQSQQRDSISFAFKEVESILDGVSTTYNHDTLEAASDRTSGGSNNTNHSSLPSVSTMSPSSPPAGLRFKPIPNPAYNNNADAQSTHHQRAVASMPTPGNDEESDDDDTQVVVRRPTRKPREETWMISSVRRPQQIPIKSQNARIFERQGVASNNTPAPLKIDIPSPPQSKQQLMANVRAHLQMTTPSTASTATSPEGRNDTAPWQSNNRPSSEYHPPPKNRLSAGLHVPPTPQQSKSSSTAEQNHQSSHFHQPRSSNSAGVRSTEHDARQSSSRSSVAGAMGRIFKSTKKDKRKEANPSRLSDGTPILHYARALWDYEAKITSEMSFKAGDVFAVINKQPDGWWQAENTDPNRRQRALIPGNYMESV